MSAQDFQINPNKSAPAMPEHLLSLAYALFDVPSTKYDEKSMTLFITNELERLQVKYEIDNYGNILVTKGTKRTFPCFCSHMDTVHMYAKGFQLLESNENNRHYLYARNVNSERVGIGGDDKCGTFVCLYLLEHLSDVKIVFFSQEESGGIGSGGVDLAFFDDCRFLGGIDRWNGHDFVNRYMGDHTISKEFKKLIQPILNKFEYSFSTGLFTDAFKVMGRKIGLSCFNMSCGYYAHHTDNEYVDLNELYNACLLAYELGQMPGRYLHEIPIGKYSGFGYGNCDSYYRGTWNEADGWHGRDLETASPYVTRWSKDKNGKWTYREDFGPNSKDTQTGVAKRYCSNPTCTNEIWDSATSTSRYCRICRPYFLDDFIPENIID
jgi:tripeptide aminopeptidase